MKRMGRLHRPFYRICAMDTRSPRDGRVIEELGYYDPMVRETDARAMLNGERIDYWLGVGAQPSDKVKVLIRKYGSQGTHREAQQAALQRLQVKRSAPPPVSIPIRKKEKPQTEEVAVESAAEASE
jgi:small subunit ribosomal protein S16